MGRNLAQRWLGVRLSGILAIAALALGSTVQAEPQAFSARYEVWMDGSRAGEATLDFRQKDGLWEHRLTAEGTSGLARLAQFRTEQTAWFDFAQPTPSLIRATMTSDSILRRREVGVAFDHGGKTVRWRGDISEQASPNAMLEGSPATGSSLNLQLALQALARQAGESIQFTLYDRGQAKPVDYVVGRREVVDVPFGRREAVPVRGERRDRERITTAWYAGGLPPTPLRLLQTERGKPKYELRLVRLSVVTQPS